MPWPGRAKLVAMSELLTQRMQPSATKLQLLRLADAVDTLVARAQESQVRVLEFLHLVLEEEVRVRAGRRFKQALKLAGLPDHKDLGWVRADLQARPRRSSFQGTGHPGGSSSKKPLRSS